MVIKQNCLFRESWNYGKICAVADVAQLVEHITRNNEVMGSIPIIGSTRKILPRRRIFSILCYCEGDYCPLEAISLNIRRLLTCTAPVPDGKVSGKRKYGVAASRLAMTSS